MRRVHRQLGGWFGGEQEQRRGGAVLVVVAVLASLAVASAVSSAPAVAEPSPVEWVSGTGLPGFVNGEPEVTSFNRPGCVASSRWGAELYVADYGNNAIRRVDLVTRKSTTVVAINKPMCLAVGGNGFLYVTHLVENSDRPAGENANGHDELVEIRPGQESNINVLSAEFRHPYQVAWSGDGTMYVADSWQWCESVSCEEVPRLSKWVGGHRVTVWASHQHQGGYGGTGGLVLRGSNAFLCENQFVVAVDVTNPPLFASGVVDSSSQGVDCRGARQFQTDPTNTKLYVGSLELTMSGISVTGRQDFAFGNGDTTLGAAITPDGRTMYVSYGDRLQQTGWKILRRSDIPSLVPSDQIKRMETMGMLENALYNGDPVNTANGNYVEARTFLSFPAWVEGLSWGATYNAQDETRGSLGTGWANDFDVSVYAAPTDASQTKLTSNVVLRDRGGRVVTFKNTGSGSWTSPELLLGTLSYGGTVYTLTFSSGQQWVFDSNGRLATMRDGRGQSVNLARSAAGLPASATHVRNGAATGYAITFSDADNDGRIEKATASDGRVVDFSYDGAGFMTSLSDPHVAGETAYSVQTMVPAVVGAEPEQVGTISTKAATDPGAGVMKLVMTYDSFGRVQTQDTRDGDHLTYVYTPTGTAITNSASNETIVAQADGHGRRVRVTDSTVQAASNSTEWYTDGTGGAATTGQLKTFTDRAGSATGYYYDAYGRLVQTARPDPATGLIPPPSGTPNETCSRNPNGSFPAPNAMGCVGRNYTLDSYSYGTGGDPRVLSHIDPAGKVTAYSYDSAGHPNAITPVKTVIGAGTEKLTSYKGLQPGTEEVIASQDGDGVTTCRYLDPQGRLMSEGTLLAPPEAPVNDSTPVGLISATLVTTCGNHLNDPTGVARTSYTYNTLGQVATKVPPNLQGTSQAWSYTYYGNGKLKAETDPLGGATSYVYDPDGQVASVTDQAGKATTTTRGWNQPAGFCGSVGAGCSTVTTVGPMEGQFIDGGSGAKVDQTTVEIRDKAGDLRETQAPGSAQGQPKAITKNTYGAMGRLTRTDDPTGAVTQYLYDNEGRATKTVVGTKLDDANGTTETTYDKAGRVTQRRDPAVTTTGPFGRPRPTPTTRPEGSSRA